MGGLDVKKRLPPLSLKRLLTQRRTSLPPPLTKVDEAHDHVGVGEEVAILQAGQRGPWGTEDGLVGDRKALPSGPPPSTAMALYRSSMNMGAEL